MGKGKIWTEGLAAAIVAAMLLPAHAGAATIPVTTLVDLSVDDDECSLREAVTASQTNAAVGTFTPPADCPAGQALAVDKISLDESGTYQLGGAVDDGNVSGDLDFNNSDAGVEIEGDPGFLGLPADTIDGGDADRVLDFISNAPATIDTVGIANGKTTGVNGAGGGIRAGDGTLAVTGGSLVIGNEASLGGGGGGIFAGGPLTVSSSIILDNTASGSAGAVGGGILAFESATIENSAIGNNTITGPADASVDGFRGGGLSLSGDATIVNTNIENNHAVGTDPSDFTYGAGIDIVASVTMRNSAVSDNDHAGGGEANGGGAFVNGDFNVLNGTFSGNVAAGATGYGGAIMVFSGQTATLVQSTIAQNAATTSGSGIRGEGDVTLRGTIIDQGANGCSGSGTFTANAFNLDRGTSCVGATADTDLTNTDPLLGALVPGGGTGITKAHFPAAGSPAVDAVPAAACDDLAGNPLGLDQRFLSRPDDGNGNGSYDCEVGAVELQVSGPSPVAPAPTAVTAAAAAPVSTATAKKCRKGFKLKKGKCKRKKRKRK